MTFLNEEVRKARKDHRCHACYWWSMSNFGELDVTPEDWTVVKQAEADGWKILKGQRYLYQTSVYDGAIQTFKGRLDMDEVCRKYGIYTEDWFYE